MVSATGHCRPFDIRSDGTIFGSGVGVVVLKSLQDAAGDGDRIHAVIRGSAINNDGSTKMTYAAPNAAGQAQVIAEAHAVAGVDAATVSFVETHGTGTPLGDPIEIEGLRMAFDLSAARRAGPCLLGSVKSNIGHLETAAGMAGLIKTVLCLEHRAIPATLHYTSPNPELHLERGPFVVRGEYGEWESGGVRRAGVSSFGVGGTNAHIIVEEAAPSDIPEPAPEPQVLLLSARTAEALHEYCSALAAELSGTENLNLGGVAHTLARRRQETIRMAAVVNNPQHAATVLRSPEHDNVFVGESPVSKRTAGDRIVFLFPGQGAQHAGMAQGLYEAEPVFAEHFDRCADAFDAELGMNLRAEIFDGTGRSLERTDRAQPALFTVEYALAKLVETYGVRPAALAGHSIGEYVAATLAGVFDVPTAVQAVAMRARLMHASPRGVMVAVSLSPEAVAQYLTDDVDLAAVNDAGTCVVSGSDAGIRNFQGRLSEAGIAARRVRTAHGFHSRLMDPVIPQFQGFMSRLELRPPQVPLLSNITGTWMSDSEATGPATWARQIRATVKFADELETLLAAADRVVVEVGPGGSLISSATRHPRWSTGHRAVRLMRHQAQNRSDHETFLLALGQLWSAGVDVDWSPRMPARQMPLVTLPGYPFVRERHWVEFDAASARRTSRSGVPAAPAEGPSSGPARPAANGRPGIAETLQTIWAQCLGVRSVDRRADFFELGGDSLVAISVAMAAAPQGLDLTPQDVYDNPTVEALADALAARYAAGGLARHSARHAETPPVPPNIAHFLEHGIQDSAQWRIPLLLRLHPDIDEADVRAVLTAVVDQHDALRLRIVARDGIWEQHIADPPESCEPALVALPGDLAPGSVQERAAVTQILREHTRSLDLSAPPLAAVYLRGGTDHPGYLALSLLSAVADQTSRDILVTDLVTAFAQRRSGTEMALQPATTTWREWSQRCTALSAHPAVVGSRGYWTAAGAHPSLQVAAPRTSPPGSADLMRLSSSLTPEQTRELDTAQRRLRLLVQEILLAALGRTIAQTVGDGILVVDLSGDGRSVLKPDVDTHRTVGWFSTLHPLVLRCQSAETPSATAELTDVREALKAVPHHGIGYGLLRYVYAPTARSLSGAAPADVLFTYSGTVPDVPPAPFDRVPVQLDADTAMPVRDAVSGLGHALELRAYRTKDTLHLDWWYDTRRSTAADTASLARTFAATVLALATEALAEDERNAAGEEMALVDLSATEA
jgi:phthiocerol/phenolphthiocerol synthesis type-I polyketide synthase E